MTAWLAVSGAASPAAAEEPAASDPYALRFEPLGAGLLVASRPDPLRFPVVGNALLIPTEDGVVLVDGGGAAAVADQIVARVNSLGSGPLVLVILTHWHDDHVSGLERYRAAFPAVRFVCHPASRERLQHKVAPRLERAAESFERYRETLERELAAGVDASTRRPLGPQQRLRARAVLRDYEAILAQKRISGLVIPALTTSGGLTLHLGSRIVEVHHLGPGNTLGDLVVYLPEERVLAGGDVLTHPLPFGFPRAPAALVATLERLLEFDFALLVPGHGEVQRDRGYSERVLALQRHAVEQIQRLSDAGLDADAIAQRLELAPHDAAITGGDPLLEHLFDLWYRQPIVGNAARELY